MMAEYELAPWGEIAGDYRAGIHGLGIAKAALGHPVSGGDFVVKFGGSNKQTQDEMLAVMRGIAQRSKGGA